MSSLQAGVSRRVISPPQGIYLMGYGNRVQGNIGVHDDLFVTTLVFDNGTSKAAVLTIDHTFINTVIVHQVQGVIAAKTQISPEAIFLYCSHSHAGPIGYADDNSRLEDRAYIAFLVEQLASSVDEALDALQPVSLYTGADAAHININRRERLPDGSIIIGNNPDGPVDSSVQIVQIKTASDTILATVVNYACHPVVMGPLNRLVSADWVGAMRQTVEGALAGLCLFIQGATADVNPRRMRWAADSWDEVAEQGAEVGEAVKRASANLERLEGDVIAWRQAAHWLRLLPSTGYNAPLRAFLPKDLTDAQIRAVLHELFPWHTPLEKRSDGIYSPLPLGVLRIGDWLIAAMGTEAFTETGLSVKANSPVRVTFFAGYTNGCNSYLPVASVYAEGGYEVETAPLFYGLPAGFVPGSAELATQMLIQLMAETA